MKMGDNMRGFTLIEVMGVIILLAVIGLIVTPLITSLMNDGREKTNEVQIKAIKSAAKNYITENKYFLDCSVKCDITLGELKKEGYLYEGDITNIKNNQIYSDNDIVRIQKEDNKYKYIFPVD